MNCVASSVAVTLKSFCWPSSWMAVIPAGMESWRKPAVLEKTRTLSSASWFVTVTDPVMFGWILQWNVYVPGSVNVCSTAAPFGARCSSTLQFALVDVTVCVAAAESNSQRTVWPTAIVTSEGVNPCDGESTASIVAACPWASAAFAMNKQAKTAQAAASSANVVRRMKLSSIP